MRLVVGSIKVYILPEKLQKSLIEIVKIAKDM
jgi:hypothetical protein